MMPIVNSGDYVHESVKPCLAEQRLAPGHVEREEAASNGDEQQHH